VKTLTDPAAKAVGLTPIPSTITELGSLAPAAASDLPRQPQGQNVYTVEGTIVAFKREADSDIHLAIADTTGPHATMIAEFPASYCDTGAVDGRRSTWRDVTSSPPTGSDHGSRLQQAA
jgi:hypothetical protein